MNETTKKLVAALREEGASTRLIRRAQAMQFDDYLSDAPFPMMDLLNAARSEGLTKIADMVIDGEFDASKEESDAWAASEDGQATFRELSGNG